MKYKQRVFTWLSNLDTISGIGSPTKALFNRRAFTLKGFYIYVKNELLEQKHYEAMTGNSIWLFLWLLDAITEVNEDEDGIVLFGRPITYEMVNADLGIPLRNYRRYIEVLRNAGYIKTTRTPYGLIMVVRKAKKVFGQRYDNNGTSKVLGSEAPKMAHQPLKMQRDSTHLAHGSADFGTSNNNKTYNKTLTTTNVVVGETPSTYGKPEINLLFDYWQSVTGIKIQSRLQANRNACNNLLKRYEQDGVKRLVDGVVLAQADPYAPRISDFSDLQTKLTQLLTWGKTQKSGGKGTIKI